MLCPFPASDRCSRPASPCECRLQSALVPMSTSFPPLYILWVGSVSFPTDSWHLMDSHGSIGISSSARGVMVDQHFVHLTTARVSYRSLQACSLLPCSASTRAGCVQARFCNFTFPSSFSHLARARVPWRVLFSQHRVTSSAVRVLDAFEPFNFSAH